MPLRRRDVVLAGAAVPVLAACSSNLWLYREEPLAELASRLGVCAAVYSTLKAGRAQPPLALSLSKPVLVDHTLKLDWGYGWGVERMGSDTVLWQWGNNPGFRSFAMLSAASKDGFVLLTNSDQGMPLASALAYQTLPGDHNAFRSAMVSG